MHKTIELSYCDCCGEGKPIAYRLKMLDCGHYIGDTIEMELCKDCGRRLMPLFKQKKVEAWNKNKNTWWKNQ